MVVIKVWLLIVFGTVECGEYCGDTRRPMIVVDNLVSKDQCIALGKRLSARTSGGSFDCSGLNKAK